MPDFLLELFSEEIPARMQVDALAHLQSGLQKALNVTVSEGFATPRRLGVIVRGLPENQPDQNTELKGPRVDAPEAALAGFLKKNNLSKEQLEQRDGVYFANIHQRGKATADLLKETVSEMLEKFPWPKSMRWGSGEKSWVRPLHSILAIFGDKIVALEFAGVKSGNVTYGHRFLAPAAITIGSPDDYEAALEKAFVVASREKRKAYIANEAKQVAASKNLVVKDDEALLEEVVGLVEYPQILLGKIDDNFMDLPPEVLATVMRSHQKYFALSTPTQPSPCEGEGKGGGSKLSPDFLITSNMKTEDGGKAIIAGNERVLRARFADARFFWDTDRNKPLSEWAKGLASVTYHAKLGSVADKVERIKNLAASLASYVNGATGDKVTRAASLCKADLVTGMVGEFAELQGIMGRYYAIGQQEDTEVADAIRDHYKPLGAGAEVPSAPISIVIALADKLDTLISLFSIGEKPTGSKDPFALRRAALGVIRIILENGLRLNLSKFVGEELLSFFHDRLKVMLKEQNIRHDVISAVVSSGDDDFVRIVARAGAVQDFLASDDGKNLLSAYKRAVNILNAEEKKDKTSYHGEMLNAALLTESAEKSLAAALEKTYGELEALQKQEDFVGAMKILAGLRASVDEFFDKIMVNCEDKNLRAERLRLLAKIREVMKTIADFSQIEG